MNTAEIGVGRVGTYLKEYPTYAAEVLKIRTKQAELRPLVLNASQRNVHAKLSRQRSEAGRVRAIILKARQLGMSTMIAGRFYRGVHLRPNLWAAVIADKKDRAANLFQIYTTFDAHLPDGVRINPKGNARGKHLIYETGSQVQVETAGDAAAGRGSTIQLVHMSEMAFWPNAYDVWVAMMQAVPDTDSEVIVESTANGVGGLFYELWEAAVAGENSFLPIFLPWFSEPTYSVPCSLEEADAIANSADAYERQAQEEGFPFDGEFVKLSVEQLKWRRLTIIDKLRGDDRLFRQEYPTTPEEAFLVSGAAYFDEMKLLELQRAAMHTPPIARGNIVDVGGGGFVFRPAERGPLKIWEHPDPRERYVLFADTAEGKLAAATGGSNVDPDSERGGRDFNAAVVLSYYSRKVVATLHGRMGPDVFGRDLARLSYYYPWGQKQDSQSWLPGFTGVEANGASGATTARVLKEDLHHPNLFYSRTLNKRTNRATPQLGWRTTGANRMPLLDDLAAEVRHESIRIPDYDTIREMFTFVRGDDGKPEAQEGCHDDRVIALAGAVQMLRYAPKLPLETPPRVKEDAMIGGSPTGWFDY